MNRHSCLLITSEWGESSIGGVGRYISEVTELIAAEMSLHIAVVPTYIDLQGTVIRSSGDRSCYPDWDHYRDALMRFGARFEYRELASEAGRIAADCAGMLARYDQTVTLFVQDYFLAPIAQALRDLGGVDRIVSFCHLPVHAGFTYFDKPVEHQVHQVLEAQLVRISDKVLVPSRFAANALSMVHSIAAAKLQVNPLGVRRPFDTVKIYGDKPRIAFVGRPNEQKGHHFLFATIQNLSTKLDEFRVRVTGGIGDNQRVQKLADDYGVSDYIDFVSPLSREAVWNFLDTHHCLVTTSVYETFGLAVLEAMASARPTIGFPVGSLKDLWGEKLTTHFTSPLGDAAALADRLADMLNDTRQLDELGERARQRADCFSWEAHVGRLVPLLRADNIKTCH